MVVLNPGYPWRQTAAVIVVVLAALLWYALGGWERPWLVTPLAAAMAAVCALATLLTAMALTLALTEPAEPPPPPARTGVPETEFTVRAAGEPPERTGPATTVRPAPTVASPSGEASAAPAASVSASASARTPP